MEQMKSQSLEEAKLKSDQRLENHNNQENIGPSNVLGGTNHPFDCKLLVQQQQVQNQANQFGTKSILAQMM